jgi:outer membrane lipoprotein-sorting protein
MGLGACDSARACLAELETAQKETATLTARFVQTKHVSLLNEPLVSSGRFVFKRPDSVLWVVEKPEAATIFIRGSEVEIPGLSTEDSRALAMAPLMTVLPQLGSMFVGDTSKLESQFVVSAYEQDGRIVVRLRPRLEGWRKLLVQLELRFGRPDLLLREIAMTDAFGDRLDIVLHEVVRNAQVPDSTFGSTGR